MTSYRDSGVDIDAQDEALREVRHIARGTFTPDVVSDIGSFGGLFRASFEGMSKPILVSSTDGVGTKLRVAQAMKIHDTVGYDLVCHCVNDILVQGARPLFFLDYYATGRLRPKVMTDVVRGMARACTENRCALIGGETAEMPGFYGDDDYDIAGFIVGVVDESQLLDGKAVREGDVLLGLPSAGLHTNGYSLARRILFDQLGYEPQSIVPGLGKAGEVLLAPHISYLAPLLPLVEQKAIHALAHITGGGLTDNVPRVLPPSLDARIRLGGCRYSACVPPRATAALHQTQIQNDRDSQRGAIRHDAGRHRRIGWDTARPEEKEDTQHNYPDRENEREPVREGRAQQEKDSEREIEEHEPAR